MKITDYPETKTVEKTDKLLIETKKGTRTINKENFTSDSASPIKFISAENDQLNGLEEWNISLEDTIDSVLKKLPAQTMVYWYLNTSSNNLTNSLPESFCLLKIYKIEKLYGVVELQSLYSGNGGIVYTSYYNANNPQMGWREVPAEHDLWDYVKKSGDTMTGDLVTDGTLGAKNGLKVHRCIAAANINTIDRKYCVKMVTIKLPNSTGVRPYWHYFHVTCRDYKKTTISFKFPWVNSNTDPDPEFFCHDNVEIGSYFYLVKEAPFTWSLYFNVKSAFTTLSISYVESENTTISYEYVDKLVDTLPDGAIKATPYEPIRFADSTKMLSQVPNAHFKIISGACDSGIIDDELKNLGITSNMTVTEMVKLLPAQSQTYIFFNSSNNNNNELAKSMPITGGGILNVWKYSNTRGQISFHDYNTGNIYTSAYNHDTSNQVIKWKLIGPNNVDDIFKTQSSTYIIPSIGRNQVFNKLYDITVPTGYKPIAISGFAIDSIDVFMTSCYIAGNQVGLSLRNTGEPITNLNISVNVLFGST